MVELKKSQLVIDEFLAWVETTSLFHAIKKDHLGTEIKAIDGSIELRLQKNVDKASDLPKEVLKIFYKNSPFCVSDEDREYAIVTTEAKIIENFLNDKLAIK